VGTVPDGGVEVLAGQLVRVRALSDHTGNDINAEPLDPFPLAEIPVAYPSLMRDIRPGGRILIDDGLVELTAERITDRYVDCIVASGGRILSQKGINLPDTHVSAPTLTNKDRDDIRFGVSHGVDYIALSFVRGPEDITAARALVAELGGHQGIIAKIENAEAVSALDEILEQSDGVMIARGDLGVEMGPEAVPILQKRIIVEANRRRRLVITATQMLESMTRTLRPTRAEASDVANAVYDGTDAVMLSAETAVGTHPIETVKVMDRIIRAAEDAAEPGVTLKRQGDLGNLPIPDAICTAAFSAAQSIGARAIVAFSERGATARLISKQRPTAPIVAFTPCESVRRRMALYWGVRPYTIPQIEHTDARVDEAERRLKAEGLVKTGEKIVILSGTQVGHPGGTNLMKLHEVR
jgi:pyruvate kinase